MTLTNFDGDTDTFNFADAYDARDFVEAIMDAGDDLEIHVSLLMSCWEGATLRFWRENRTAFN